MWGFNPSRIRKPHLPSPSLNKKKTAAKLTAVFQLQPILNPNNCPLDKVDGCRSHGKQKNFLVEKCDLSPGFTSNGLKESEYAPHV